MHERKARSGHGVDQFNRWIGEMEEVFEERDALTGLLGLRFCRCSDLRTGLKFGDEFSGPRAVQAGFRRLGMPRPSPAYGPVPKHFRRTRLRRSSSRRECLWNGEKRFSLPVRCHGLLRPHGQLVRLRAFFW